MMKEMEKIEGDGNDEGEERRVGEAQATTVQIIINALTEIVVILVSADQEKRGHKLCKHDCCSF